MGLRDKLRGFVKPTTAKDESQKSSQKPAAGTQASSASPVAVSLEHNERASQPHVSSTGNDSINQDTTSGEQENSLTQPLDLATTEAEGPLPQDGPTDTPDEQGTGNQTQEPLAEDGSLHPQNASLDEKEETDEKWLEYQDVWSQAYYEALQSLTDPKEKDIMKNSIGVTELFANLEGANKKNLDESLFRRGLKKIQKPLKGLKFALSMASPLSSMDPTVSTAFGIVSSVSAVCY